MKVGQSYLQEMVEESHSDGSKDKDHSSDSEVDKGSDAGSEKSGSRSLSLKEQKKKERKERKEKKERSGSQAGSKESSGSESDESHSDSEEENSKDKIDKKDKSDDESAKRSMDDDVSPQRRTDGGEAFSKVNVDDDTRSMNYDGLIAKLAEIQKQMGEFKVPSGMEVSDEYLWKDEDFPPINKSITKDEEKMREIKSSIKHALKWMRPQAISKDAKFAVTDFSKCDLKFGYVSDAVFTSALGLLAIHSAIDNLFVNVDHVFDMGFAVFQFFKNGEWRYVIVDTNLPYSPERKQFLYSECGESNEFWVQLVEKAYAKLNGSYANIQGMDICEVLVDLTGGVSDREEIDADKYKEAKDAKDNPETAALYTKIINFLKNKYLLGCVKHVPGKPASSKEAGERGIYENLYYGMMGLWEVGLSHSSLVTAQKSPADLLRLGIIGESKEIGMESGAITMRTGTGMLISERPCFPIRRIRSRMTTSSSS